MVNVEVTVQCVEVTKNHQVKLKSCITKKFVADCNTDYFIVSECRGGLSVVIKHNIKCQGPILLKRKIVL